MIPSILNLGSTRALTIAKRSSTSLAVSASTIRRIGFSSSFCAKIEFGNGFNKSELANRLEVRRKLRLLVFGFIINGLNDIQVSKLLYIRPKLGK